MYYTSSGGGGGGGNSGYSGQDGSQQYYGSGTGLPPTCGSNTDSSRFMSDAGMSYGGSASWVDSSLASAQRSLQSWKSVGLSASNVPSSGMERTSGMVRGTHETLGHLPVPGAVGSQLGGPGGRGATQTRPRLATGVQTFQPKGGAHPRGNAAVPPWLAGTPNQPTSVPSTFRPSYSNTGQMGSSEYRQGQNQAAQRAVSPATQFGRGTSAPVRGPAPRATSPSTSVPSTFRASYTNTGQMGSSQYWQGQNQAAQRATTPPQQLGFGRGTSAPARGPAPRPANVERLPRPQSRPPGPPQPNTDARMTGTSPAVSGATPLMSVTPFQARLQNFSTKSCNDLGIAVQPQAGKKKLCSLEGFSTKPADTSSEKVEVKCDKDNNDNDDDDDDDDSDDDEEADMTQCKLCNIKFEKTQVFHYIFKTFFYLWFSSLNVFLLNK